MIFKGRPFDRSVILLCAQWYLADGLSLRNLESMMAERGMAVDPATIHRWVIRYSPELLERFNSRKRAVTGKWHVDETYIRVRGQWRYLYRAIDSNGDTLEFWFSEKRNLTAARRFLREALKRYGRPVSTRDLIREGMRELATETGHSCWMSVLSGTDITIIDGIHGGYPIRLVVEVGSQLPSHATAAGKALLSRLDDDKIRALFRSNALPKFTTSTLDSIDRLLSEVAIVRERGWAETRQEIIEGITSISVALTAVSEPAGIALSVSFPVSNLSKKQQEDVRHALLRTAAKLGRRIGDTNWNR